MKWQLLEQNFLLKTANPISYTFKLKPNYMISFLNLSVYVLDIQPEQTDRQNRTTMFLTYKVLNSINLC